MSINQIALTGRLTKDPDLRYTAGGKAVTTLRLAVDRGNGTRSEAVDYIDVVLWEQNAEVAANNLQKGRLVGVQGRLQVREYDDKEGKKREKAEVVASGLTFLDKPANNTPDTTKKEIPDIPI